MYLGQADRLLLVFFLGKDQVWLVLAEDYYY